MGTIWAALAVATLSWAPIAVVAPVLVVSHLRGALLTRPEGRA